MAKANSTNQSTNGRTTFNGFDLVTRSDIENFMNIAYEQSVAMAAIYQAIGRLTNDETIKALCSHGALQAEFQGNDLDALRERALKAGVIGAHGVSH